MIRCSCKRMTRQALTPAHRTKPLASCLQFRFSNICCSAPSGDSAGREECKALRPGSFQGLLLL
jgi:hypothetical protein